MGPCPCASQTPCETRFRDRSAHWTDAPRRPYPATDHNAGEGHDALTPKDPDAIARLTPEQYRVTQASGHRAPGTGEYLGNKEAGI